MMGLGKKTLSQVMYPKPGYKIGAHTVKKIAEFWEITTNQVLTEFYTEVE